MRRVLQVVGWLAVFCAGLWFFGPREPVKGIEIVQVEQNLSQLAKRLEQEEAAFDDITPGVEKRIIFADGPVKTDWSVVYIHGFSATSEEIRPVPDLVAKGLGANLFYTRLTGHGRGGAALGKARAVDWIDDTSEALAIGRALGDKVLVMGTSTGATLAALSLKSVSEYVDKFVFVSPNFEVQAAGRQILTFPFARQFVPLILGEERKWDPRNSDHGKYWTTTYPSTAVVPLAAVTKAARLGSYDHAYAPALVFLSNEDTVVQPQTTRRVMDGWGGGAEIVELTMEEGDDPDAHVIAGDIMSPGQTDAVVQKILSWLEN